ncbi:MAG: hypothetical protein WB771_09890 [Solirubrobacterales bacterium]
MKRALTALSVLAIALFVPASALATDYAPPDQPGPALSVPRAALEASLTCAGNLSSGARGPVLLVPGTAYSPKSDFSWNWEPALHKLGIPWCVVALPGNGMGDVQTAAEYVVNGIRTMYLDADVVCIPGCAPSFWQQADRSAFIKALNSYAETFPGISYTVAYTRLDEVVVPNLNAQGSSALHGGGGEISNVAVQEVCPLDLSEHLAIGTYDPVAYALAIDAISHPGPADPSRLAGTGVCRRLFMPGVNPLTFATDELSSVAAVGATVATYPRVPAEPPLRCYVTADCP